MGGYKCLKARFKLVSGGFSGAYGFLTWNSVFSPSFEIIDH